MFDKLAWSNPEALWLNLTNAALGLVVLVCCGIVTVSIVKELVARLVARRETHAFHVAGLGLTMADGGEPVKPDSEKAPEKGE